MSDQGHRDNLASFHPFAWLVRGMLWMAGIGMLVLLLASGATLRMDNALYDAHLKHWTYDPGSDVVIVAIDPKSLDALGRWPWPRSLHARLIDRLTATGVRGIGLDVVMSSGDTAHPGDDLLLADAIHRAGNVVLPVLAESADLGGPLQETLPLRSLAEKAAAIGHVGVAADNDGLVRSAYLKAGLGQPYWPSFALALYRLGNSESMLPLPGMRDPYISDASPYLWMRDYYALLRYAGPEGSFGRVSYIDVLNGDVPASLLKDRLVLIGATAEGMGDMLQTPLATMPGVEYQANVLESLRHGLLITPLGFLQQLALDVAMLLLPLLLYGLPRLKRAGHVALMTVILVAAISLGMLRIFHLWWPPTACLLTLGIQFTGWSLFVLLQRRQHDRNFDSSSGPLWRYQA